MTDCPNSTEIILRYLEENFFVSGISSSDLLITGGRLDSMQAIELAMFIEDKFGCQLEDDDMDIANFDCVDAMDALIVARVTV